MSASLPTLVIVGRPNVGKSTMFNRLAGRRIAVVQDQPGVTRDRLYAEVEWKDRRFRIVDTGGILFSDDDPLIEQIRVQAQVAMAEADLVLFVTDSAEGLNSADWDLANSLRSFEQPIFVVANKSDNEDRSLVAQEFHALGIGDVYPVSSLQDKGFDILFRDIIKTLDAAPSPFKEEDDELKLAIIGRPNVGKSSMVNALTGENRVIVSDIPGTTRDAVDTPITYKGRNIRLIDTAGIRRRGKTQGSIEYYMVLRAQKAIRRADCALLVVDGREGLTDGDKRVAKMSKDEGKPLVIAINKWDLVEPPDGNLGKSSPIKKDWLRILGNEIPEVSYAIKRFTSAQEESGMDGVMNAVFKAVENWNFRVGTGVLNRIVQDAQFERPLTRKGLPFKVRYITQPSTCPPTFIAFCNNIDLFHFSYQRFIENKIREQFPMEGTPIELRARASSEDRHK
ncbi:MAG: ribosome biogenesis GTPase Der [Armatimonadetes bacterium]|nr:ribosome biogenesis GTPase Der [Armatimonadota bacterium]